MLKKKFLGGEGGGGGRCRVGGCSVGGVRVDVNEELKFLVKFTKNNWGASGRGGSGGGGGGVGLVRGGQG